MDVMAEGWLEAKKIKTDIAWLAVFRGITFRNNHGGLLPLEWAMRNRVHSDSNHLDSKYSDSNRPGTSRGPKSESSALNEQIDQKFDVMGATFSKAMKKLEAKIDALTVL